MHEAFCHCTVSNFNHHCWPWYVSKKRLMAPRLRLSSGPNRVYNHWWSERLLSARATGERQVAVEMMGGCCWAHGAGWRGTREQGNSSIGGQWAHCPYEWWWRPSCRRGMGDTITLDATRSWGLMMASPRPGVSRLTLGSSQSWSCPCKLPVGEESSAEGSCGWAGSQPSGTQPAPAYTRACTMVLSFLPFPPPPSS